MEQQTTGMPVMEPKHNGKKYWIIGGSIIVLAIAGFMLYGGGDTTPPPQGIAVGDQNSLDIGDQNPDAVAVLVSQASFITPGFIVIEEDNNGTPGKILATSSMYNPGFFTNKTVIMTMSPGATYFGTLYGDNGNGIFDASIDQPLTDPAGATVRVPFKVKMSSTPEDIKG